MAAIKILEFENQEKQKGPQERQLRADHRQIILTKSISHNYDDPTFEEPIFSRFFNYLRHCGGCIGLRDRTKCRYALVCAYVEKISLKAIGPAIEERL